MKYNFNIIIFTKHNIKENLNKKFDDKVYIKFKTAIKMLMPLKSKILNVNSLILFCYQLQQVKLVLYCLIIFNCTQRWSQ